MVEPPLLDRSVTPLPAAIVGCPIPLKFTTIHLNPAGKEDGTVMLVALELFMVMIDPESAATSV
jgi:hypothetical protein